MEECMDITGIAQLSTSMAETGTKETVGIAVLKKAAEVQTVTATAMIEALPPVTQAPNLPGHLGGTIDTTA
jgi:hypothetical protein